MGQIQNKKAEQAADDAKELHRGPAAVREQLELKHQGYEFRVGMYREISFSARTVLGANDAGPLRSGNSLSGSPSSR